MKKLFQRRQLRPKKEVVWTCLNHWYPFLHPNFTFLKNNQNQPLATGDVKPRDVWTAPVDWTTRPSQWSARFRAAAWCHGRRPPAPSKGLGARPVHWAVLATEKTTGNVNEKKRQLLGPSFCAISFQCVGFPGVSKVSKRLLIAASRPNWPTYPTVTPVRKRNSGAMCTCQRNANPLAIGNNCRSCKILFLFQWNPPRKKHVFVVHSVTQCIVCIYIL